MIIDWIIWATALIVVGQVFAPLVAAIFQPFPDRGLAFAKPLALVVLTFVAWLLGSAGLDPGRALTGSLAAMAVVVLLSRRRSGRGPRRRERLLQEALFVVSFLAFSGLRALQPAIFGAEKYMDFAFFNACLRAESFPPVDPWLSGVPVNYYYFGYLIFANWARLTHVAPEIAYNLSLATIGAVLFTVAVSIGRALTRRLSLGIAAGAAVAWLGNLDGFLQVVVERKGLFALDYWRSSRVVPNTINEFPFFSLLHGDLHPHVASIFVLLPLIGVAIAAWLDGTRRSAPIREHLLRPTRAAVVVLLLTSLSLTNPWDLPVALVFLGVLVLTRLWDRERPFRSLGEVSLVLAALLALTYVLSMPFTRGFVAPFHGVGRVHARTELREFLTVFGLLFLPPVAILARSSRRYLPEGSEVRELTVAAGALGIFGWYVASANWVLILTAIALVLSAARMAIRTKGKSTPAYALVATAALALLACELVFFRDSYGETLHRMNTVFKLYFQAWIFLALAWPFFAERLVRSVSRNDWTYATVVALLVAGVAASLCYPVAAIAGRVRAGGLTLDGTRYLDREHPDDAAAIRWIRSAIAGRPVVLEATGDPYSYFARVSSNTGLPTVLGWANHEGVWRGSDPRLPERRRAVEQMYRGADVDEALSLLREYGVRYVFVGELEHDEYAGDGLRKFREHPELFVEVFRSGATAVYEVR